MGREAPVGGQSDEHSPYPTVAHAPRADARLIDVARDHDQKTEMVALRPSPRSRLLVVHLVGEALAGCLPGDAEGDGELIPGAALCAGDAHRLSEPGFVGLHHLRRCGDGVEVAEILDRHGIRVKGIGELFEPLRGLTDPPVAVLHRPHLISRIVGTSAGAAWRG